MPFSKLLLLSIISVTILLPSAIAGHYFDSINTPEADYIVPSIGGSDPEGMSLLSGISHYNSTLGGYEGALLYADLRWSPTNIYRVVLIRPDTENGASNAYITAAGVWGDMVYFGGEVDYGDSHKIAVGAINVSSQTILSVRDVTGLFSGIRSLKVVSHPYYGKVLLVLGDSNSSRMPRILFMDPRTLDPIALVDPSGWNTNWMDSGDAVVLPGGSLFIGATLSAQGHMALVKWDSDTDSYTEAYVIKYINGLYVNSVTYSEEDGHLYGYIAGDKKYNSYTDWGTGSDLDPVLIKVNLSNFTPSSYPFEWVAIFNDSEDDNAYCVSWYPAGNPGTTDDVIVLLGGLEAPSTGETYIYPMVALLDVNGGLERLYLVPGPVEGSTEQRGEYRAGFIRDGYIYAIGGTMYAEGDGDYYNTGVLFFSRSMQELEWQEGAPSSWHNVTRINITDSGVYIRRTDINFQVYGPYDVAVGQPSITELSGIKVTVKDPASVYRAEDNVEPIPIPEPAHIVTMIVILTSIAVLLLELRRH
ncbi:MAG: hypothetical protein F7C35_02530 [Desulfurococcales archaeon]|nr:hypothetical protein [Desulfurococcales archaeon]